MANGDESGCAALLYTRSFITFGSTAAATANRTFLSAVAVVAGMLPSGLPVQPGAGRPALQVIGAPEFMLMMLPAMAGISTWPKPSFFAVATMAGSRMYPA